MTTHLSNEGVTISLGTPIATSGAGEANTASNIGSGGVGVVATVPKAGVALQFRSIIGDGTYITTTLDDPDNEVVVALDTDTLVADLNPHLIKEVDVASATITYFGEAEDPTAATSEAKWRIFRFDSSGGGGDESKRYADDSTDFDKIWDDRASFTY